MAKLMSVATLMAVVACGASAFCEEKPAAAEIQQAAAEGEEESDKILNAGFDFDFYSAYVYRNAASSDEMVMQPCVWADINLCDWLYVGGYVWQNYSLTNRRREIFRRALDETDYNVHVGMTPWQTEDEDYSLGLELGHEWFTYQGIRNSYDCWWSEGYPASREIYLKVTFDNPFVNVYGQASWMYKSFGLYRKSMHYELGLNKEVELTDSLTLGADWNVNFGDPRYLGYLFGGMSNPYYEENDDGDLERYDDFDADPKGGIGATTIKVYLTWKITDWMSLGGVVAYTGVLNSDLRDSMSEQGGTYEFAGNPGESYPRDLLWGGLQLKFEY